MLKQRVGIDLTLADRASSRRSLAIWIWSVLLIVDLVLVTRRLSGEFATPLPVFLALFSTAFVAVASWLAWLLFAPTHSNRWIPQGISTAVVVVWSCSISAGSTPLTYGLLGAVTLMPLVAVLAFDFELGGVGGGGELPHRLPSATVVAPQPLEWAKTDEVTSMATGERNPWAVVEASESLAQPAFDDSDSEPLNDESDENLTLWLSRRLIDDGEQIEGWIRVDFAPGQRETVVHVSFCPPLSGTPQIETEDLDGTGSEIRVAAAFPFGTRLSVRRSGPLDEEHSDRIGFIAQSMATHRAA